MYFLFPKLEVAKRMVDELLLARIEERHLPVLARRGTPLEDLSEASFMQKSDFVHAVERCRVWAVRPYPCRAARRGSAWSAARDCRRNIAGVSLAGAGVGAWFGGMMGMNVGNTRLKQFEDAIEHGSLLVMTDVPRDRVDEIEERVRKHLPGAEICGTEPTIPAFSYKGSLQLRCLHDA